MSQSRTQKLIEKYLKLYLYFLVLFLPLVFIQKCEDAYYMPKLILLTGGMQFLSVTVFGPARKRFDALDWSLLAFAVLYATGLIKAGDKITAVISVAEWFCCAGVFLFIRHYLRPSEIKRTVILMLLSALIAGIYALLQSFNFDLKGWVTDFSGRAFSSMGNPDFLGGFLILVIPLAFYDGAFNRTKFLAPLIFIFLSAVLILSQTRSSLAAFGVSLILLAFLVPGYFKRHYKYLAGGGVILAAVIVLSGVLGPLITRITSSFGPHGTDLSGRFGLWLAGLHMVWDNFFTGAGINSINSIFTLYRQAGAGYLETDHLHNDFIEIFAASGVLAFGAFAIFLSLLAAALMRKNSELSRIGFVCFIAMMIQAFFNFPFFILDSKLYFFAIAGLSLAGDQGKERVSVRAFAAGAALFFISAAVTCVFLAASCYLNYAINSANTPAAGQYYESARFYPGAKKYYYTAGMKLEQGRMAEAMADNQMYLFAFPYSKQGKIQQGIISAESGDPGKAIKVFDSFLKYYPEDTDVLNNKGRALYMKGDKKEAIELFKAIIKKDPSNAVAHNNLYGIYYMNGMKQDALKEQERWEIITTDYQIRM